MRCGKFDKLIYLFLDRRLEQSEEKELKEHLSECERCAKKLALLESVEEGAKKIEAKEPPQEYWDSFSIRVREKILARKERSLAFGLKKALESIFSFSPFKIKVAAGLISIVLVFIIGKLYMDYRGQELLPSKMVIQKEKPSPLGITKIEKKEGFPIEERRKGIKSISEKPEKKREPATPIQPESEDFPQKRAGGEKGVLTKEEKAPAPPEVSEETPTPAYPTDLSVGTSPATKKPSEQIISPKAEPTGAGMKERLDEEGAIEVPAPPEKVLKDESLTKRTEQEKEKSEVREILTAQYGFVPRDRYMVNQIMVPKIAEDDTLMQAEELTRTIQVWKAYIEENPTDTLTNQGYLQVATCYYLLAKLSPDTTFASEGSKLIQKYLDQIEDRGVKEELSRKLKQIKALRGK